MQYRPCPRRHVLAPPGARQAHPKAPDCFTAPCQTKDKHDYVDPLPDITTANTRPVLRYQPGSVPLTQGVSATVPTTSPLASPSALPRSLRDPRQEAVVRQLPYHDTR